ncbi:MAG: hypothetical protein WDN25_24295 [Acetobacteraceae bacterium]
MAQVIHLAAPTSYPGATAALEPAESTLVLAIRWWVADHRQGDDPLPRLCQALEIAGAHDAAFAVDRLMAIIARTVRRPVAVNCPRCPNLSDDEKQLLYAAYLVQSGEAPLAERALRTAFLSAQGAEFALGSLEGITVLFGEANLVFPCRQQPAEVVDAMMPWTPSGDARTLH